MKKEPENEKIKVAKGPSLSKLIFGTFILISGMAVILRMIFTIPDLHA